VATRDGWPGAAGAEGDRPPRPAVFVDRDGTLIRDLHYLADPAGVELLPGAAEAVARLNRAGVPVVLVTNQSGIGRGYFTEDDYRAVHRRLVEALAERGAALDGAYHCPDAEDGGLDADRKPGAGMFLRAARELGLDLAASTFVGDRTRDVAPAARWGARAYLVAAVAAADAEPLPPGVERVGSFAEAVDRVLAGG
jgi:D-glycero-D-manno-heptose 1,7-bisphosphate phosphatase